MEDKTLKYAALRIDELTPEEIMTSVKNLISHELRQLVKNNPEKCIVVDLTITMTDDPDRVNPLKIVENNSKQPETAKPKEIDNVQVQP